MKEWYTPSELADLALPDMPTDVRSVNQQIVDQDWRNRCALTGEQLARKDGQGGGWKYHWRLLSSADQAALLNRHQQPAQFSGKTELWSWYNKQNETRRQKTRKRYEAVRAVRDLEKSGVPVNVAVAEICRSAGCGQRTLYEWLSLVGGKPEDDWLPLLCPRHHGRTKKAEISDEAWEWLKGAYLNQSARPLETNYDELVALAEQHGWVVPSLQTVRRKMHDEIPEAVRVLLREGSHALSRLYPAQRRDRSGLYALEACNVDGHKLDVLVRLPNGKIDRVVLVAIQDLYSNFYVAWRIGLSESTALVRLTFLDAFAHWGIMKKLVLDNGRAFASKYLTGGTPNRYRFKVREEDPLGVLTEQGVEIHWAQPAHGQSKPIERSFGDLCNRIARHPEFVGAYTGNSPENKPENYGSKAIDFERFVEIVNREINRHNAKTGRKTKVCGGVKSFQQAFEESYRLSTITKPTIDQLQRFMLAAEQITASKVNGEISLLGNRYWDEFLLEFRGQKMMVRFDPDNLHQPAHIYRADGAYLGEATCISDTGFFDKAAAKDHAAKQRAWRKAVKQAAELENSMSPDQVAAMLDALPVPEDPAPVMPAATRMLITKSGAATAPVPVTDPDEDFETETDFAARFRAGLAVIQGGKK